MENTQTIMGKEEHICALDPLGFDQYLTDIPQYNNVGDTGELVRLLYKIIPHPDKLENYNYLEAAAVMRDLGIIMGSLKRFDIEPVEVVPELDYILAELAETSGMPPRDTLLHYTFWNPQGSRLRTYTGTSDEKELIQSVRMAMPTLEKAIFKLQTLQQISPLDSEYKTICIKARENFEDMIKGILHARSHVSPVFFAKELRLYFDPIQLYGKIFLGPGAVEMPVFVFDHILWSNDTQSEDYIKFKETYLPYTIPSIREVYEDTSAHPNLITQMIEQLNCYYSDETLQLNSLELYKLCQTLKKFRMPHKQVADRVYQAQEGKKREVGSGGYTTDVLQQIIELMNNRIDDLYGAISKYKKN